MLLLNRISLILLILIPINLISPLANTNGLVAAADGKDAGDTVEGEDEAAVQDEDSASDALVSGTGEDETEDDGTRLKPSPDVDTHFLFTKPSITGLELPADSEVHFLVGFANNGQKEFVVDSMDASFRYAMDFNFHIQNFSALPYNKVVKPNEETTLAYAFFISEAYSTRPYGLTVNLHYKDREGNQYLNAVFNETVTIVEKDTGLDAETIFLYLFLLGLLGLLAFGAQQLLLSLNKKRSPVKTKVEQTISSTDVDYDWLPPETLQALNKSPRNQKQSPRQRKVKRGTGSEDK